jgi:hypothetical protein
MRTRLLTSLWRIKDIQFLQSFSYVYLIRIYDTDSRNISVCGGCVCCGIFCGTPYKIFYVTIPNKTIVPMEILCHILLTAICISPSNYRISSTQLFFFNVSLDNNDNLNRSWIKTLIFLVSFLWNRNSLTHKDIISSSAIWMDILFVVTDCVYFRHVTIF